MPDYFYQCDYNTGEFKNRLDAQLPPAFPSSNVIGTVCPFVKITVDVSSEEDLDEYMKALGYSKITGTKPNGQNPKGEISMLPFSGPIAQIITSTPQKCNLWNSDKISTSSIITADQANKELSINSLFDTNQGDTYKATFSASVQIPNNELCIVTLVHDDNGALNVEALVIAYGFESQGISSFSKTTFFEITSSVNQKFYADVYTVGGSETIIWHAGNLLLERVI